MLRYKEKRWDSKRMLDSGGMPSSHSTTVSALAVAIGIQEGAGSPAFAVAVVLACIVMYDASGVRLHAGRQAELLNQIVCELPPEHPLSNVRPLGDSLGHTPLQDAVDAAKSAMVSVIGLDSKKVQRLCDAANQEVLEAEKVQIANYLCPAKYVVSGGIKGVEVLEAKAKSFKARMTVRLAVAGAFHTSFMEPAVSRLEAELAATEIRTPRIPVISNVDAHPHANLDTIKKILARQVTSPVQWETTVKTFLNKGLKKSYELGPGKVIAGIVKRMDKGANIENVGA